MVQKLFGSNTRVKLLKLFLFNPNEKYFVRELTRILDEHINSIRRELENLLSMEIIKEVKPTKEGKSNKKYYKINNGFGIYNELRALFAKLEIVSEDELKNKIKELKGVEYFALTGVFCSVSSPIDILVIGEPNQAELNNIITRLETTTEEEINYTVMSKEEFIHRLDLTDKFLYEVLDKSKIVLKDNITADIGAKYYDFKDLDNRTQ
jgi:predicted transcriptional regulator